MQADGRRRGDGHCQAVEKSAAPEDMKTWSQLCARLCVYACVRACVCLCASVCLCVRVCVLARTPNSACPFPLSLPPSPLSPSGAGITSDHAKSSWRDMLFPFPGHTIPCRSGTTWGHAKITRRPRHIMGRHANDFHDDPHVDFLLATCRRPDSMQTLGPPGITRDHAKTTSHHAKTCKQFSCMSCWRHIPYRFSGLLGTTRRSSEDIPGNTTTSNQFQRGSR